MSHEFQIRVYYEDTDLAGIVYYANYLKFFERGRSEAVRDAGIDQRALKDDAGLVFAVRRAEIDYHSPATLDDIVTIRTQAQTFGGASITLLQEAWVENRLLSRAVIKVACMTTHGKPTRFPADIREKLLRLVPRKA